MQQAMGHGDVAAAYPALWELVDAEIVYQPGKQKFGRASMLGAKEKLEALEQQFTLLRARMGAEAKTAGKMEKKAGVLLLGFMQRTQRQREGALKLHEQIDQAAIELETFEKLRVGEQAAIPARIAVREGGI